MGFELPEEVLYIMRRFSEAGHRADAVGGCVRDMLMGVRPHDFDLTTDAFPEQTMSIFAGERMIATGLKHGTVTLLLNRRPYEITTYRVDGSYADNRHPDRVTFTRSLKEDLARRDFTVNAMAYHPDFGLTDLFGGRTDLAKKQIRAVGDAEMRFCEDALRILRAIRFASRLGFSVEEETARAVHSCRHLLKNISAERIDSEWKGILEGKDCMTVLSKFSDIAEEILPEFNGEFSRILSKLIEKEIKPSDRLIAMCAELPEPAAAYESVMDRLRADNIRRKEGEDILREMSSFYDTTDGALLRLCGRIGEKNALRMLGLRAVLTERDKELTGRLMDLLTQGRCYRIAHLAVTGTDLMRHGFRGKEIGEKLSSLLQAVTDGVVPNEKTALMKFLTH